MAGRIGIIGGTGLGDFPCEGESDHVTISTPWGSASARVGTLHGREVVFLARHGGSHSLPPHRINFRANTAALRALDVRAVLATAAVGGLRPDLKPGTLLLLDDLIDFTLTRAGKTFFDARVVHTDMTEPYSPVVRATALTAADSLEIALEPRGTYLCTDGPRYETPAEVRLFASWGADVVGMTGAPEATLAREAGIHYAAVALVTNPGAGISKTPLSHEEVVDAVAAAGPTLRTLLVETLARLDLDTLPAIGPGVSITPD